MARGVPRPGVAACLALPPLVAVLLSCGPGTHGAADAGVHDVGPGPELSITTTTLPGGMVDVKYHTSLAAKGGLRPLTWQVSTGSLPTGLSLNPATGAIDGVP